MNWSLSVKLGYSKIIFRIGLPNYSTKLSFEPLNHPRYETIYLPISCYTPFFKPTF